MQIINNIKKAAAVILSAASIGIFSLAGYYSIHLPENVTVESASAVSFARYPELSCISSADGVSAEKTTLSLFGTIPVKSLNVHEAEAPTLIVSGQPFGVKLLMEGVMVTGMGKVDCGGEDICPAELAGIEIGDIITSANGSTLTSNSDLQRVISGSCGSDITLSISRSGASLNTALTPVLSESSGKWRGGMWVRDSIAGIGTMTFIDPDSGKFAGLGHPVCDSDTGEIIPISSGEAVPVEITGAHKGTVGIPGELQGRFTRSSVYGTLDKNCQNGIYGRLSANSLKTMSENSESMKMGYCQDITTGKAFIYSTVIGDSPKKYSAEIESIDYNSKETTKNMVIHITDPELIEASGGIVQGMSGSPIIQNGKLVGAVTHVFIADPTRGYAIFAENMLGS